MEELGAGPQTTVVLHLNEAAELAGAWVDALAQRLGIRAMLIKGPALQMHGLREPRVSSDVDVLVEPTRFDDLCAAIHAAGWVERPSTLMSKLITHHSRTFLRVGWPCDLDVHSYFPGFLSPSTEVFEKLWLHRCSIQLAHRDCHTLDKTASAVILALHSLRGSSAQSRHIDELERLLRTPFNDSERRDLASLALATGCVATLDAVLPRMGVVVEPTAEELSHPDLRLWRERVSAGSHGAYLWMLALRRSTWSRRPALLWRAVWPTRRDIALWRPDLGRTVGGRAQARVVRWGMGIRTAPSGLRALWKHRRKGG
ncbi:nucleotidyltransferase family protein [Microbacterium trichothecenolyticum]|uniref:nucleotidyltransferase family protein n=1 Tax=Microbacterium trichothecenolyticum TaxID=69370 RepID=UPI001C6E972D|nr:nucleotidyltransferase family protein [Microbacterium trichothecenolyticum]